MPSTIDPVRVQVARRVIVAVAALATIATPVMAVGSLADGPLAFKFGEALMFGLCSVVAAWIGILVHRHRALGSFLTVVLGSISALRAGGFALIATAYEEFGSLSDKVPFIVGAIALTAAATAGFVVGPWDLKRSRE